MGHATERDLSRRERLARILERDGPACVWCRRAIGTGLVRATTEHLVPKVKGGPSWIENEVAACARCNRQRGHRTPAEWVDECERRGWLPDREVLVRTLRALAAAIDDRGGQRRGPALPRRAAAPARPDLGSNAVGTDDDIATVRRFWASLYARDWTVIRSFFDEGSIYFDVPVGPGAAGVGPDGIEARLRLGLEGLAGYDHEEGPIVGGDGVVMTEHKETWRWASGETVTLPFVSVQRVRGGVIELWKDYWDQQTLMAAAPAAWHERLATADLSWVRDVTGQPGV